MKKKTACVRVFLCVAIMRFVCGPSDVFASHESIVNVHAAGQADAEELLTFRIEEVLERRVPSRCAADPQMVRDERKLDPQLPACDTMKHLVLLIQNDPAIVDDSNKPNETQQVGRPEFGSGSPGSGAT